MISQNLLLTIVLAPLLGAIVAGLFGRQVGRVGAHSVTIAGVAVSCALSGWVLYLLSWGGAETFNQNVYTWFEVGGLSAHVGFLVDRLTAMMMVVVTFVSLLVHVYTIGYMAGDPGYQRFFSYISLFTFSMLMLVMSNNFLQLFFGWEGVGLASYLLIGFWYKKPEANAAAIKALKGSGVVFEDYDFPGLKTVDHVCVLGAEKAAWLMDTQYQHYRRLAMVARNAEELQQYRARRRPRVLIDHAHADSDRDLRRDDEAPGHPGRHAGRGGDRADRSSVGAALCRARHVREVQDPGRGRCRPAR